MPSTDSTAPATELQAACRHLLAALHRARQEPTHRTDVAQDFISEIESLRRFALKPGDLRRELQQSWGEYPSFGSALVDCLFQWVPPRKTVTLSHRLKAPDKFLRRLYATITFLLDIEFSFLYASPQQPCQLVVTNEARD